MFAESTSRRAWERPPDPEGWVGCAPARRP